MGELLLLEVHVPLFLIGAFIIIVSLCFLFHRDTLGLLVAFVFVFNWGSYANRELILEVLRHKPYYWITYLGGAVVLVSIAGLGVWSTVRRNRMERERAEEERFRGVLEMAGAACHELSQPLQVVLGLSQLIGSSISKDDPLYEKLEKMNLQIDKMGGIIQKIMNLTTYETREYLKGVSRIIDIEKASGST